MNVQPMTDATCPKDSFFQDECQREISKYFKTLQKYTANYTQKYTLKHSMSNFLTCFQLRTSVERQLCSSVVRTPLMA